MNIIQQPNLASFHTFGIAQQADTLYRLEHPDELITLWQALPAQPFVMGEGANLLFVEPVAMPMLKLDFKAVSLVQEAEQTYCRVEAGKDWHELVVELTEQGLGGLENLALIPGSVGAAPVQNIGAYGVEFCQLCESVDVFDWHHGHFRTISTEECRFGYRDSIFKHEDGRHLIIVAVTLKLPREWIPHIEYKGIKELLISDSPSPKEIMEAIVTLRQQKLPDPEVAGNAGSFFKNPTLSKKQADFLQQMYPNMPYYPLDEGVKVPAAWLIDQRGWKGKMCGGAQVHPQQALVLVNKKQAKAQDITRLAHDIQLDVSTHFGVNLQPEVRFIGALGELTLEQAYASTCV